MIRTLSTFALLAALAGPAAAQDVHVSVAGKDAKTIHFEIEKAAWSVCTEAYLRSSIGLADMADCARSVADDALAQAEGRAPEFAQAPAAAVLASNDSRELPRR